MKKKGKWGFINEKGELIADPVYDNPRPMNNGYTLVQSADSFGVIDPTGKLIIPCEMDEISWPKSEMLRLWKGERSAYYNLTLHKQVWTEEGF